MEPDANDRRDIRRNRWSWLPALVFRSVSGGPLPAHGPAVVDHPVGGGADGHRLAVLFEVLEPLLGLGVLLLGIWLTAIGALFADEQKKTQPPAAPPGEIKPAPKPTLPPGNPAEQIKTLISQYDQASEAFRRQIEAARSNADQLKLYGLIPDRDEYARLLIGIAEKNPKDRAAFEALTGLLGFAVATGLAPSARGAAVCSARRSPGANLRRALLWPALRHCRF